LIEEIQKILKPWSAIV